MILVTGATGMFGGRITAQLTGSGVPLRVMTSSRERAERLKRPGVEPVVADMDRPETLSEVMDGVDTVFLVSPMDDRVMVREGNVLERPRQREDGDHVLSNGAGSADRGSGATSRPMPPPEASMQVALPVCRHPPGRPRRGLI